MHNKGYYAGIFTPPKSVRGLYLRDGLTYGQDIVFPGYFDCSDHILNVCLDLEALDPTLHHLEVVKITKKWP